MGEGIIRYLYTNCAVGNEGCDTESRQEERNRKKMPNRDRFCDIYRIFQLIKILEVLLRSESQVSMLNESGTSMETHGTFQNQTMLS